MLVSMENTNVYISLPGCNVCDAARTAIGNTARSST